MAEVNFEHLKGTFQDILNDAWKEFFGPNRTDRKSTNCDFHNYLLEKIGYENWGTFLSICPPDVHWDKIVKNHHTQNGTVFGQCKQPAFSFGGAFVLDRDREID